MCVFDSESFMHPKYLQLNFKNTTPNLYLIEIVFSQTLQSKIFD